MAPRPALLCILDGTGGDSRPTNNQPFKVSP